MPLLPYKYKQGAEYNIPPDIKLALSPIGASINTSSLFNNFQDNVPALVANILDAFKVLKNAIQGCKSLIKVIDDHVTEPTLIPLFSSSISLVKVLVVKFKFNLFTVFPVA